MKNKQYEKPKTLKKQVDLLFDIITNDIYHQIVWQNMKIGFILAIVGLTLALVGGIIGVVIKILLGY